MGTNEKDFEEILKTIEQDGDALPVDVATCMLCEFSARMLARILDHLECESCKRDNDWR